MSANVGDAAPEGASGAAEEEPREAEAQRRSWSW